LAGVIKTPSRLALGDFVATETPVGNVRLSVRRTSFCRLALERKDLESPKTARTYSTARTAP